MVVLYRTAIQYVFLSLLYCFSETAELIIRIFGILQTCFALLQVVAFFLNEGHVLKYRGLLKYMPRDKSFMLQNEHDRKVCV